MVTSHDGASEKTLPSEDASRSEFMVTHAEDIAALNRIGVDTDVRFGVLVFYM